MNKRPKNYILLNSVGVLFLISLLTLAACCIALVWVQETTSVLIVKILWTSILVCVFLYLFIFLFKEDDKESKTNNDDKERQEFQDKILKNVDPSPINPALLRGFPKSE